MFVVDSLDWRAVTPLGGVFLSCRWRHFLLTRYTASPPHSIRSIFTSSSLHTGWT